MTGVSRNRVVSVTYGEMGSPPWGNSDNPEEEYAEIDNGNAPHEPEAEVEREAEDTVEREAAERVREVTGADGSAAARACGVAGAGGSNADLAENSKVLKVPFFPLLGLLGRITASSPRVICTDDACPPAPILSARALNILRVGMGAGTAAVGISFSWKLKRSAVGRASGCGSPLRRATVAAGNLARPTVTMGLQAAG